MTEKRFSGKIGEDYNLYKQVVTYYENFEENIARTVFSYNKHNKLANEKSTKQYSILEIGCGTGLTTEPLLRRNLNAKITSVDNEPIMLNQAKKDLKKYVNQGRLELIEADALEYLKNYNGNNFNIFVSGFTLHNFNSQYRFEFLKEVFSKLSSNGLFVNGDKYSPSNPEEYKKAFAWELEIFKGFDIVGRPDLREKWVKHYYEDEHPDKIMKLDEAVLQMDRIGYKNIHTIEKVGLNGIMVAKKP